MRLSAHLLVAACAAGLATAETLLPKECRFTDLSLNATNADALANCTLYSYKCVPNGNITYTTTAPPVNCPKLGYSTFFHDYNMTGPLVVPRMVEAHGIYIHGYDNCCNFSATVPEPRNLLVDSIDFPDLVNAWVLSVKKAQNVNSLKFPKVENISALLDIDLLAGPAISLSFPSLRVARAIIIKGKINGLDFPALNSSNTFTITSTGDRDCVAFAATVLNTTKWPTGDPNVPESFSCTSTKNSIKTHPVSANDTEDTEDTQDIKDTKDTTSSSGVSWFRADLLFLVVLVGSVSLVV